MIRFGALCALWLGLIACSQSGPDRPDGAPVPADLVIEGGEIYTSAGGRAAALAIRDGRFVAVGDAGDIARFIGPATERIDLKGGAAYPGFTDSHAHLLGIGFRELTFNLEGVGSIDALVSRLAAQTAASSPGDVIWGRGWIETNWPERRFPTRDDLDPVSPDNPVLLERADGHATLANTAALLRAGIDAATADPPGGRIERFADGRPTGLLVDEAAQLVADLVTAPNEAAKRRALRIGAEVYARHGWTGLHNMSVDPDDVALIEAMAEAGELPIRVYNAVDRRGFDALRARLGPRADPMPLTGMVTTRALKLYVDGALGSRGALLAEPYADRPDTAGLQLLSEDEAAPILESALREGVQIAAHAIGDRGNTLLLDWISQALITVPPAERRVAEPRWRIEHAQILNPGDFARFAELGVIASMQPSHAIGDLFFAPDRLGPRRLDGAYAWRALIDAGAVIAAGSDAPVERGDPRIEFYAAVARRGLDGYADENWRAEQAVRRTEALKMLTAWPAYARFAEADLGVIEPGKIADLTIFSHDLMTVPEDEILQASALMTIVGGRIVYRAEGF